MYLHSAKLFDMLWYLISFNLFHKNSIISMLRALRPHWLNIAINGTNHNISSAEVKPANFMPSRMSHCTNLINFLLLTAPQNFPSSEQFWGISYVLY